jgi:dihydropteroate synthase
MTRQSHRPETVAAGGDVGRRFAALLAEWRAKGPARTPLLMGIVNVTPDSFSDGGCFATPEAAVAQGRRLAEAGAAILDIGGESTRKAATPVSAEEERRRVLPVVRTLAAEGALVSIDTMKADVAEAAIGVGAAIVNDIRGLQGDPRMAEVAARHGAGVVAMHNPGILGSAEPLKGDPVEACLAYFERTLAIARSAGVGADRIVLDPGLGFGKSPQQNLALLKRLPELQALGFPILIGASRKSFIGAVTGRESKDRLVGTLVAGVVAALGGAAVLRVHDVAEHREAMLMTAAIEAAAERPAGPPE